MQSGRDVAWDQSLVNVIFCPGGRQGPNAGRTWGFLGRSGFLVRENAGCVSEPPQTCWMQYFSTRDPSITDGPAWHNDVPGYAADEFQMVLCKIAQRSNYFTVSSVIDHFVSIVMACALRGSLLVDSESDPSSSDCS